MKLNRYTVLVLMVFVLTLGAGVFAGLLAARLPNASLAGSNPPAGESSLAITLGLSNDQREQMRSIWEGVSELSRDSLVTASKFDRERDEAVVALISLEKREQYNQIQRAYSEKCAVLKSRRESAFDKAVKKTNEILTPPQREKYAQLLAAQLGTSGNRPHTASDELPPSLPKGEIQSTQ